MAVSPLVNRAPARIRNISGPNEIGDRQAEYINKNVPLTPFHPFKRVKATNSTNLGGIHCLPIHNNDNGTFPATGLKPDKPIEIALQANPDS